jgi:3-oxoacyl-[acyl-carrier protein] reductase
MIDKTNRGIVKTPMTMNLGNEQELYDALGSRTALKRLAEPEEVSRVILFLLSSEASYITGTVSVPTESVLSLVRYR